MKRPSHLEMAGWGLVTLLGAWVLAFKTDFGSGLPAFWIGLSIGAGRASGNVLVGLRTLILLVLFSGLLLSITSIMFITDSRLEEPVTSRVLPGLHMRANPAPGDVRLKLYFSSVWSALVCAMTVRFSLDREGMAWAVARSASVFALTMAVHMVLVMDWMVWEPKNAHFPKMLRGAVVSVYSLMPVYAGYFVALFWDMGKAKDSHESI